MVSCRCRRSPSFEPLQDFASCFPRASMRRAAHNSIFFLFPAFAPERIPSARMFSSTLPARRVLGHTVKELPSRGLKSRSGASHRDRQPVSRPPTDVTAREARTPKPHPSTHFEKKSNFPASNLQLTELQASRNVNSGDEQGESAAICHSVAAQCKTASPIRCATSWWGMRAVLTTRSYWRLSSRSA